MEDASGVAVANVERAKFSGVSEDWVKSMEENDIPPEETSGILEMVVWVFEQVMLDWMLVTVSWTSAGRVVLPITKQAVAREVRAGAVELLGE